MENNSKNLVYAARYIDAMYDIQIDENDPNLDQIIQKILQTLNSNTSNIHQNCLPQGNTYYS